MDIRKLRPGTLDKPRSGARSQQATPSPATQSSAASDEDVQLTPTARAFQVAHQDALTVPFDEARVQALKTAIAEGRYLIDSKRLASKMLELERLLS